MKEFVQPLKDTAHDLIHTARLIENDHIRDDRALLAIIALADDLKQKAIDEAKRIRIQAPLFAG